MSASFLDRVLARLDGAVACIWITGLFELREPIDRARLVSALDRLALPRLHHRWTGTTWSGHHPAYTLRELPAGDMEQLINDPIDLRRDPALRVTLFGDGRMAIQLHHAAGDGRSFIQLHERLGALYAGQTVPPAGHQFGRAPAAKTLAMGLLAAPTQLDPANRLLARRGHALHHRGGPAGRVLHVPLRVDPGEHDPTGLFFGAVAAAAARWDPDATRPIRLRVPVDLRRPLGLHGVSMENASAALPLEITREEASLPGHQLIALLPARIRELVARGVPLANLVTLFVGERISSDEGLRSHIRPEMLADPRANTLVTTYVGSLDRALQGFPVRRVSGHTPTWGVLGYRFQGQLCWFFSAFEGLWTRDDLRAFVDLGAGWLEELGLRVDRAA